MRTTLIGNAGMRCLGAMAVLTLASIGFAQTRPPTVAPAAVEGGGAQRSVSEWLMRMHEASRRRAYVGTFVVSAGGTMSSARIWHVCDGEQQMERVESLTGVHRSTFRRNQQVVTFLPESRVVITEKRESLGLFPNSAAGHQLLGSTPDSIHGPFTTTTDSCAACHRTHADPNVTMAPQVDPVATLCFSCHDGTGASPNVYNEYYSGTNPDGTPLYSNNSATRSIFTHDALSTSNHQGPTVDAEGTTEIVDEFSHVLNRHSECTDCHNPHSSDTSASTQTSTGWTAPGRVAAATGVSVVNGAAGSEPAYTLRGAAGDPITLEYQLCFKCHSGYTTLPSNSGFPSSQWYLDKGMEFNPANGSTHPVEAAGSNNTAKMDDSLGGASPYKLWSFTSTSTIRCTNCHAGGTITPAGGAGQISQPHAVENRGILLAPYRDRVLRSRADPNYSDADFQLCYGCHTNIPFTTETTTATNFAFHYKHMSGIGGVGSVAAGTNIDTPGDGAGNAICAECHYRLHSSQSMVGPQDLSGTRLVSFPPSVEPVDVGGVPTIKWDSTSTGHGTCTLLCHGKTHNAQPY